ncbi:MAG: hypothetical protein V7L20_11300 [Nostoc sp.]
MKPYSCDLRQKVINVYNNQEGSQGQLAIRLGAMRFCEVGRKNERSLI